MASLRSACGWVRLTGKQSTMKDYGIDRVTYVLWRCAQGVRKQGVIHVFDPIQSVKSTNTVMLRYHRISQKSGQSTLASLSTANVCMWLGPSHRQAKHNEKISGVDGSLTSCGDAQKESENNAFIPVFDPIQSVKSTNKVTLRYTRVSQKPVKSTLA